MSFFIAALLLAGHLVPECAASPKEAQTPPLMDDQTPDARTERLRRMACEAADQIVIGTIERLDSWWTTLSFGKVILTDATFMVERVIYGPRDQWVRVSVAGGRVGDGILSVSDSCLLYTSPSPRD